jgi:hypothetical protein
MAKAAKKARPAPPRKESSSAFFARLRPKFLDWNPPTEDELRQEAQQRKDERDAELRKVTALEKAKLAEKKSGKKKAPVN